MKDPLKRKCNGHPPRLLELVLPWWETPTPWSHFTCSCPIPEGATPRDMIVHRGDGYVRWRNDPNRPALEQLSRLCNDHLKKYS